MYLRLPLDSSTAGYNRAAALWVAMFAFTLMPSETACTVWNQERAVARAPPHGLCSVSPSTYAMEPGARRGALRRARPPRAPAARARRWCASSAG